MRITEKVLQKAISRIITNSLEPGQAKDTEGCNLFQLYSLFASSDQIASMQEAYLNGVGWGDAKKELFAVINEEIAPIREKYFGKTT